MCRCALVVLTFIVICTSSLFAEDVPQKKNAEKPKELLVNFQGKSVAAWWDIGIADAIREHLVDHKYDKIYFGGNSSGSLLPAYLGCWGVSEETIKGAREIGFMVTRGAGK